ncbi:MULTISPECIES: sensor histidine kinase [unclassified Duganella]|uniref:sensor histidine kinase n=1 Tax=unclassified Duganella TaxID=2636909 RepID=UPI0006F7E66E|nr:MULTISPECIES: histidine kinase [unclassified Duganella]KQV45571.1 autolysin [Duganella sp. Root336D2]KRC00833.1 autolysin [Duganella sp. Root198D2]
MFPTPQAQDTAKTILAWLHRGFDATTGWVTHLSWWKFFLFAALSMIAASILQDELFSPSREEEMAIRSHKRAKSGNADPNITIDDSGIHFNPRAGKIKKQASAEASGDETASARHDDSDTEETAAAEAAAPAMPAEAAAPADPAAPAPPAPPAPTANRAKPAPPAAPAAPMPGEEVHIELPPQIGEELSNALEQAVDSAAEEKVSRYHKQASTWFTSFITLLLLALFAMKALVGGKKKAEAEAQVANAAAERESMQRQLSEAKMQMMQAQVEPHFLFNTLASVEHLIETDPPRASAMQRSLIKYLRAVLPQMRENKLTSTLGSESDMVAAYLALLKMRMEERLIVDFDVPEGLRSAAFPPMMLQSMVENAIKHGLEGKPEGGYLKVRADVAHSKLRVTVSDDGLGFGAKPSTGTGLGLTNIRERLKLLHGDQASLKIEPNQPSGVIAIIEVPYQLARSE